MQRASLHYKFTFEPYLLNLLNITAHGYISKFMTIIK